MAAVCSEAGRTSPLEMTNERSGDIGPEALARSLNTLTRSSSCEKRGESFNNGRRALSDTEIEEVEVVAVVKTAEKLNKVEEVEEVEIYAIA
jgi:hypothetical protein